MLPDKFLKSFDGVKVAYRFDKGDSSKPVLVFVHGLGGNCTAWDGVVDVMQKAGFSTVVFDFRGHGLSEKRWNKKFYSVSSMVKDICLILEKENIDDAVFLAHSLGGSVVLKYLLSSNSRVSKIVLCNSPHTVPFIYSPYWFVRTFYPVYSELASLSEIGLFLKDLSAVPLRVFCWNYLLMFNYKIDLNVLGEKDIPALLITSDQDKFLSPDSVVELSKIMKDSKLVKIKECDHETIIRKPEEISKHVLEFLE